MTGPSSESGKCGNGILMTHSDLLPLETLGTTPESGHHLIHYTFRHMLGSEQHPQLQWTNLSQTLRFSFPETALGKGSFKIKQPTGLRSSLLLNFDRKSDYTYDILDFPTETHRQGQGDGWGGDRGRKTEKNVLKDTNVLGILAIFSVLFGIHSMVD